MVGRVEWVRVPNLQSSRIPRLHRNGKGDEPEGERGGDHAAPRDHSALNS
jgi:hypothetical protein